MTLGFFDATTARQIVVGGSTVTTEISLLELSILANIANAHSSSTITHTTNIGVSGSVIVGTPMTKDTTYYSTWAGAITDNVKVAQMNQVISHFTGQGYGIARRSNDSLYMNWVINW